MNISVEKCSLCAWRESCQKKFSVSGKDIRCPEFVKDMSLKDNKTEDKQTGQGRT